MSLDDAASQRQHAADLGDVVRMSEEEAEAILAGVHRTGDIREVIDLLWAILRRLP